MNLFKFFSSLIYSRVNESSSETCVASSYEVWKNFNGENSNTSSIIVNKRKRYIDKLDHIPKIFEYEHKVNIEAFETNDEPALPEDIEAYSTLNEKIQYEEETLNYYQQLQEIEPFIAMGDVKECHHSEGTGCLSLDCWYCNIFYYFY